MKLTDLHWQLSQSLGQNSKVIPHSCLCRAVDDSELEVAVTNCQSLVLKDLQQKMKTGAIGVSHVRSVGDEWSYALPVQHEGDSVVVEVPFGYKVSRPELEKTVETYLSGAGKAIPGKSRCDLDGRKVAIKDVKDRFYRSLCQQLQSAAITMKDVEKIAEQDSVSFPYKDRMYDGLVTVPLQVNGKAHKKKQQKKVAYRR